MQESSQQSDSSSSSALALGSSHDDAADETSKGSHAVAELRRMTISQEPSLERAESEVSKEMTPAEVREILDEERWDIDPAERGRKDTMAVVSLAVHEESLSKATSKFAHNNCSGWNIIPEAERGCPNRSLLAIEETKDRLRQYQHPLMTMSMFDNAPRRTMSSMSTISMQSPPPPARIQGDASDTSDENANDAIPIEAIPGECDWVREDEEMRHIMDEVSSVVHESVSNRTEVGDGDEEDGDGHSRSPARRNLRQSIHTVIQLQKTMNRLQDIDHPLFGSKPNTS